jgi:hypothetical protein
VLAGADPILQLFTWFSGMSAIGVVLLMAGCCWRPSAAGPGAVLRSRRPNVYRGIGATAMAPEDETPTALPTLPRSY